GGGDDRGVASDQPFRFWHRLCILFVNDPRRLEVTGISRGVRDIILVAQEDVPDAAHALEGLDQMRDVSRRVDQPIAMLMTNEITVGAERLLRIEAVVVHARSEMDREAGHGLLQAGLVLLHRPNRANRTGDQGTPRILQLRFSLRLAIDGRIFSHLAERGWSQLPAGVAVDAGRVHEEIAYYVRRQLFPLISHVYGSLSSSSIHLPDQNLCSLRLVSNQTTRTGRGQPDRITGR